MTRRIFMWVAVLSLTLWAIASITTSLAATSSTVDWRFYTPYSTSLPPRAWLQTIYECALIAQRILLPTAALSCAGYILSLEKHLCRTSTSRGFEVMIAEAAKEQK